MWTGPALEEFRGEEWADGEIARLTEIHAGTVDDLADELIAARRSADAVALLERQIADHPYRDRSRGLLIRGLASGGRQGDALRAFQHYRSLLIDELGTEPSAGRRPHRAAGRHRVGRRRRATGPQASAGTGRPPTPETPRPRGLASSAGPPSWTRSPRSWRSSRRQKLPRRRHHG